MDDDNDDDDDDDDDDTTPNINNQPHVALSAKVAFDQFWPPPPHPPKSRDMDSLLAQLSSNPVGEVQAHPSLKARLVSSFDCEKDITVLST